MHARYILLKRPNENVILDINLRDKVNLKFFSLDSDKVIKMRECIQQYGVNWHEYF